MVGTAPVRMCRVCRRRLPKAKLTRWVRREGAVTLDAAQQLSGRGSYTCSAACAAKLPTIIKSTNR